MAKDLKERGFCAFGYNYGTELTSIPEVLPFARGVGDMNASARQLATIVATVKNITGSDKVDIVAHSQGATITKMYMQQLAGSGNVNRFVSLGGTGATQQVVGSPVINELNT